MRRLLPLVAALAVVIALVVVLRPRAGAPALVPGAVDSAENGDTPERAAAELRATPAPESATLEPDAPEPAERRAPAVEPAAEPVAVLVRVTDDRGAPVADARVRLRVDGEVWADVGAVDAQGHVRALVPGGEGRVRFRAGSPRHRESEVVLARPLPATVLVELATTGWLAGSVRYPDRSSAGAGVTVTARSGAGTEHVASTVTDARGDFAIEGLDVTRSYRLTAVAAGLVSRASPTGRPGGTSVLVEVGELYGVLVHLVDEAGAPVDAPDDPRWRGSPLRRSEPAPVDPELAVAAGLPAHLVEPRPDRRLLLYAAAPADDELESVTVAVARAGFAPASIEIAPRALRLGLAEARLVLRRIAAGRVVVAARLPAPRLDAETRGPQVELWLAGAEPPHLSYSLRLGPEPAIVEGVPAGRYTSHLRVPSAERDFRTAAATELDVVDGGTTRLALDLRDLGAVRLPRGTAGWLHALLPEGAETTLVDRVPLAVDRTVAWSLFLLPPGEYVLHPEDASTEVILDAPLDGRVVTVVRLALDDLDDPVTSDAEVRVPVVAGETTTVELPPR